MGADPKAEAQPLLDLVEWSEAAEVPFLQAVDIGIMPLSDTPWARGKCGYKLIQYMACGLPVVASPVGVNAEIVEHGVNGFLATTEAEWSEALATLLRDPALRQRMGAAGRRKVEEHYSLQVWGPRVAALLLDVAEKSRA
jgi:glycosyltransferase involved in cell wall biosynthesis